MTTTYSAMTTPRPNVNIEELQPVSDINDYLENEYNTNNNGMTGSSYIG